jgi:hypothetical protein
MDDLEKLFSAYRQALPDPEASADFTPGIWRKIEARRSPVRFLRRMAEAFVTVAALVTLLIGTFLIPSLQRASVYSASYIDVLTADHSSRDFAEVTHADAFNEAAPR